MTQELVLQVGDLVRARYLNINAQPWHYVYNDFLILEVGQDEVTALSAEDGTIKTLHPEWWRVGFLLLISRPEP